MRGLYQTFTAICLPLGLCLCLASCNTSDALTPKADIPNTDNKQQASTKELQNTDTRQRMPKIDEGDTQQAMARGEENPSLTKSTTLQADQSNTTLSAGLYKNSSDTKPANNLYSATQTKGTIRFLPIIGAPVQAVTPLSRELGNSARSNGLVIKGSSDQSAEHVLKGYLSAFADGKNVTVVYVWDVLDNSGARMHRIQGQETVPAKATDAWTAVPPELMQQIGNATIAEYMKWLQSQG